jgi:hypothetical protein
MLFKSPKSPHHPPCTLAAPPRSLPVAGVGPDRPPRTIIARDYRVFDILALPDVYLSNPSPLTQNVTPADSYGSDAWDDLYALYVLGTGRHHDDAQPESKCSG